MCYYVSNGGDIDISAGKLMNDKKLEIMFVTITQNVFFDSLLAESSISSIVLYPDNFPVFLTMMGSAMIPTQKQLLKKETLFVNVLSLGTFLQMVVRSKDH